MISAKVNPRVEVTGEEGFFRGNNSIIRGKHEGEPEGAKRPIVASEKREFTLRIERGSVPHFSEKALILVASIPALKVNRMSFAG